LSSTRYDDRQEIRSLCARIHLAEELALEDVDAMPRDKSSLATTLW
jgi:hypothetical protein